MSIFPGSDGADLWEKSGWVRSHATDQTLAWWQGGAKPVSVYSLRMEWWVTIGGLVLARSQHIFLHWLTNGQRLQTLVWHRNLVCEESDKWKYFLSLQTWFRGWTSATKCLKEMQTHYNKGVKRPQWHAKSLLQRDAKL